MNLQHKKMNEREHRRSILPRGTGCDSRGGVNVGTSQSMRGTIKEGSNR